MADYKTIRGTATFEYEEKRSRFIATASFADTEEKALAVLNAVRAANRTARHNVYAYVLQNGRVPAGWCAPTRRQPRARCKAPSSSACGWSSTARSV